MWDIIVQFGRRQHITCTACTCMFLLHPSLSLLLSVCLSLCLSHTPSVCLPLCHSFCLSLTPSVCPHPCLSHSFCLSSLPLSLSPSLPLSLSLPLAPGFSEDLKTLSAPSSVRSGGECVSEMLKLEVVVKDGECILLYSCT